VVGLPGAGLWALIFLIAAVLQVGAVTLIPDAIYVFATMATGKAVAFLIWCIFVGLIDNVLKPLLLGRRAPVPILVIFLGAIGGFAAMGFFGLFVGAIVISVGYNLFTAWLGEGDRHLLQTRPGESFRKSSAHSWIGKYGIISLKATSTLTKPLRCSL